MQRYIFLKIILSKNQLVQLKWKNFNWKLDFHTYKAVNLKVTIFNTINYFLKLKPSIAIWKDFARIIFIFISQRIAIGLIDKDKAHLRLSHH